MRVYEVIFEEFALPLGSVPKLKCSCSQKRTQVPKAPKKQKSSKLAKPQSFQRSARKP